MGTIDASRMRRSACRSAFVVAPLAVLVACALLISSCRSAGEPEPAAPQAPGAARVSETVEGVSAIVEREYFAADTASRIAQMLRAPESNRRYTGAMTDESLATLLTADLYAATNDKHLAVRVVAQRPVESRNEDSRAADVLRTNAGIRRAEILAGNVGYLEITAFFHPEEAGEAIGAAMRRLRSASALIIDLRENGGGSPETVALVASYLFDAADLALFDIVPREGNAKTYKTTPVDPSDRNASRPLFLLTSARTFSGGEGLAFILQERHRGEVIGETTAGAANPGRPYSVGDRFEVVVPNGQVRTTATGRNWEGAGVIPDVPAPAADALRVAQARAATK